MAEESLLFLFETFDIITCTVAIGVLYGIAFTLYCLSAWPLYCQLQEPDKRRRARFTLGCISLLLLCATGILALNSRIIQLAYIDYADFLGGPPVFELSHNSAINPYDGANTVLDFIVEAVTMAIQIRRLWIIWSGTRYSVVVTILPVLLFFSYIALDILTNVIEAIMPVGQLGISNKIGAAMITTAFALQSTFTVLVTGLIAIRLLLARRQHMKVMGMSEAASPYLSIVTMLVESYVLDSAWSLATTIASALPSISFVLLSNNDSIIKVVAYFLVVYRVETGRGWTKQTEEKLTSLQWNRGTRTATDEASGTQSRVTATVLAADSWPATQNESAI